MTDLCPECAECWGTLSGYYCRWCLYAEAAAQGKTVDEEGDIV